MKILVIGSGAREHAIVWKFRQSPQVDEILVAPGNAGTSRLAHNLNIAVTDIQAIISAARQNRVDFTFVGPEIPLANGLVDEFQKSGLPVFGPTSAAARIESSKAFSKSLMHKYGIPTARSRTFSNTEEAIDYVKQESPPIVIKADGLAAGKGVIISQSIDDAITSIESLMDNKSLGTAGDQVIVEEYMNGREISMFVFTDGQTLSPPVTACDYKRIFDSNEGPNTGGMGSFSPANSYSNELGEKVFHEIMRPTVRALASENSPFCGVLYGGLMITDKGPRTIEFNCRLGDPETQVIMPRLNSDLVDIACAVIEKRLGTQPILWSNNPCVGVVMASAGYPGDYPTGLPISGLEDVDKDILIFHAGTKVGPAGEILTAGGRVLTVVAQGSTLFEARQKVYNNLPRINFDGAHYRTDIAQF